MEDHNDASGSVSPSKLETIFSRLNERMKSEPVTEKIDEYLRSLVTAMIIITPETYPMDRIFHIIMKKISEFRMSTSGDYLEQEHLRSHWINDFSKLMLSSIVRRETLNLDGNIVSWSEETVESWSVRTAQTGRYYIDDAGAKVTQIERWAYGWWEDAYLYGDRGICADRVILEEYDDRYVERYPKWKGYNFIDEYGDPFKTFDSNVDEMISRTIWKHDLWRDELHTQPFKVIHSELLYSSQLPKWYRNEYTQSKEHFEQIRV